MKKMENENIKKIIEQIEQNTNDTVNNVSLLHAQRTLVNRLINHYDDNPKYDDIINDLIDIEAINNQIVNNLDRQDMNLNDVIDDTPNIIHIPDNSFHFNNDKK